MVEHRNEADKAPEKTCTALQIIMKNRVPKQIHNIVPAAVPSSETRP